MKNEVTKNEEQKLFVIPCNGGFTCLGFQVCEDRAIALGSELASLGYSMPAPEAFGTLARYAQYAAMTETARVHYERTGYRFHCELSPQLLGLEGKRVEVVTSWDEKQRFWVSKSAGWIPVHLAVPRRDSSGGGAAMGPFKSVRVVCERR